MRVFTSITQISDQALQLLNADSKQSRFETAVHLCAMPLLIEQKSVRVVDHPLGLFVVLCHISVSIHRVTATLSPFCAHTPGSRRLLSQTACVGLRRGSTRQGQPAQIAHQLKLFCGDKTMRQPPRNVTGSLDAAVM